MNKCKDGECSISKIQFDLTTKDPLKVFSKFTSVTQGKFTSSFFTPKDEEAFYKKHMRANHSTLRCIHFIVYGVLPKTVIAQLIRATKGHPQPVVQTSRPDNTGKERSSDPYELIAFAQEHTAESFLALCRQRLCYKSEDRTRKAVEDLVSVLERSEEPFFRALGSLCVPSCVYTNRCDELKPCGYYESTLVKK